MPLTVSAAAAAGDVASWQHSARASCVNEALMGVVKPIQQPQSAVQVHAWFLGLNKKLPKEAGVQQLSLVLGLMHSEPSCVHACMLSHVLLRAAGGSQRGRFICVRFD